MRIIKILTVITGILFLLNCADGIQVETKVKQLIKAKKLKTMTVTNNSMKTTAIVDSVKFQNQIMQIEDKYYNLGEIVSIEVKDSILHLNF